MEFLKAYVASVREEKGWQHIAQHPHFDWLRPYWLRAIARDAGEGRTNEDELADAFHAGYGTTDEDDLWLTLLKAWDPRYSRALEDRLRDGSPSVAIDQAALACLLEHDRKTFPVIVSDLRHQDATNRLVEIGRGIAYLSRDTSFEGAKNLADTEAFAARMPQPFSEICNAEIVLRDKRVPVLSDAARAMLAAIPGGSTQVRELRLKLDAHITLPIEDDVRWALGASDEFDIAILAIDAAIRHGMTAEVNAALDHPFAHVAARALTALATPLTVPLPQHLLALARHRASPVRLALVKMLKAKPDPAHKATLIHLAHDQWSKNTMHYGYDADDYPIAQAAISALSDLGPPGIKNEEYLLAIATDSSDPNVRASIFGLLAKLGATMQKTLFELALEPGRTRVRTSAARALLGEGQQIDQDLVAEKLTARMLATRYEPVAGAFSVLLGWRGPIPAVRAAAEELATDAKRRVLLLLIVWALKERDPTVAEEIAAMLPPGHKAVDWALGNALTSVDDETIADLGDAAVCAAVLKYMRIKPAE